LRHLRRGHSLRQAARVSRRQVLRQLRAEKLEQRSSTEGGRAVKTKEELRSQWRHARAAQIREKTKFLVRTSQQRILATKTFIALLKRLRGAS
jgi:hypothetical protein